MTRNPKILLVDDDPAILRGMERSFMDYDVDVVASSCPNEAAAIVNNLEIDVIVCDHQMPGKTGLEFLEKVRQERPNIHLFMLSGQIAGLKMAEKWAQEIGVKKIFSKPCDAKELANAIFEVTGNAGVPGGPA